MIETTVNWDFEGNWMKDWKNSDAVRPYGMAYNEEEKCICIPPGLGSGTMRHVELKKDQLSIVSYDFVMNTKLLMLWQSPLKYFGVYFDFSPTASVTPIQPLLCSNNHYFISYGTSAVKPVFSVEAGQRLQGMSVMIAEPLFAELLQLAADNRETADMGRFEWENFFGFSSINKDMCQVWSSPEDGQQVWQDRLYLTGNVYRLMSLFLFNLLQEQDTAYNNSGEDIKKLIMLDNLIRKDGIERVPLLDDAAKEVMMSASKFKMLFKKHFGLPYYSYYKDLRLKKAKELLIDNQYSVQQVLYKLGYKSASNFTQAFVQKFGVLPSNCRKII